MTDGVRSAMLVLAGILSAPVPALAGGVEGTLNADVVVYGRMFHWAVAEGGGWAWRYDGEGGCVYEYDAYNSPTFRGDYDYSQHDEYSGTWYVYGGMGNDHIYTPSEHDSGSLVCYSVTIKVETDTVNQYEARIHGDDGNYWSGDGDTIHGCPSWHCLVKGNGGSDDISGGTAYDSIDGEDGFDVILGGAGDDYLYGGTGNDSVFGNDGDDHVYGWDGNDNLYGGDGTDYLYGQSGEDDDCDGGDDSDYCGTGNPYYCESPLVSCSTGG